MSRSTSLLIMIVGILAALSSWLSRDKETDGLLATRPKQHIPDYYISGFSAAAYTAAGVPRHRLSAENMTHYADDGTTQLVRPNLAFLSDKGETWQLDSGRGRIDTAGDTLLLTQSVNIRRAGKGMEPIELQTRELTIHPNKQTATTRSPITVTAPGMHLEAAGLDASFAEERLVLYSVKGRYEP